MKYILIAILLSGCATIGSKEGVVVCQAADTITTIKVLNAGGHELNPFIAKILTHGYLPFIAFKAGFAYLLTRDSVPDEVRAGVNVVTCGVAAHNAAQ